jgi:hypothetical protein
MNGVDARVPVARGEDVTWIVPSTPGKQLEPEFDFALKSRIRVGENNTTDSVTEMLKNIHSFARIRTTLQKIAVFPDSEIHRAEACRLSAFPKGGCGRSAPEPRGFIEN